METSTLFWIIAVIVVVGLLIWYLMSSKKGGKTEMKGPTEPTSPPSSEI